MKIQSILIFAICCSTSTVVAQSITSDVERLIESSCISCHDTETETELNLERIGRDLSDGDTFRVWERIYDRVVSGEMPPESEPRPDETVRITSLASLKSALVLASQSARGDQRASLRRLTRLEYGYTIQDLLHLDAAVAKELAETLPSEADSGGFDTVAANQSLSSLHVRGYLAAADRALEEAIRLGPKPKVNRFNREYARSTHLNAIANARGLGLGIVLPLEDAVVAFFDFGATYTFHSQTEGFDVPEPGRYRVSFEAYPYQAKSPVGLTVYRGRMAGTSASLDELIGSFELDGDATHNFEMSPFLRPGDLVSPSVADLLGNPNEAIRGTPHDGYDFSNYKGEGVAIKSLSIEGPIHEVWPPRSTRQLLTGVELDENGSIQLTKDPYEHIVDIVATFGQRAFRRPLEKGEIEAYASLAKPILNDGRSFIEAARASLRAILCDPSFLFLTTDAEGLDDVALASRLSYFLWRSMPDSELLKVASKRGLSKDSILRQQVDRMLADSKCKRFVHDFAGQAFRLYEIKATTPDKGLYPEYDDRLGQAMARETQLFLAELVTKNLGVGSLIDGNFTFLNRRLAMHYGVEGIRGQQMRRVELPTSSSRGGLLTQASILKITANGTTTSPVSRGNFVLANLMGQPAPAPPEGVGNIEPDTRGTMTVREQLNAHRSSPQCATCHQKIDPPGFALEAFDPIGGLRSHYRIPGGELRFGDFVVPAPYKQGAPVDSSGKTSDGHAFQGVDEYKKILLENELDQLARHLASQFLVFSTGAEITFADRDAVETIVSRGRERGHPIRDMIHEVVRSDLFRTK